MFRKERDRIGDVFALLVDEPEGHHHVTIFTPHGHTSGPLTQNIWRTRPAKPSEYAGLLRTMQSRGYRVVVVQRTPLDRYRACRAHDDCRGSYALAAACGREQLQARLAKRHRVARDHRRRRASSRSLRRRR
jgi:hypothetical protein